jgi:hypothetical protein
MVIEPAMDSVSYLLRFRPPIGEQYEFTVDPEIYRGFARAHLRLYARPDDNELAPFRWAPRQLILVGEEEVVNTAPTPDEFVRHKILDIVGDLYLLGYPIRGRVTARLTGHRDNIAMLRLLSRENTLD